MSVLKVLLAPSSQGRPSATSQLLRIELSQSNDVLVVALGASDWRTGVQNSSDDTGRKENLVSREGRENLAKNRICERAKSSKEYVLMQFWQSFVDDSFDLENLI